MMVGLLLPAIAASTTVGAVNTTMNLPFSWDTLPRYTFCGNETKNYTGFPLRDSAVDYISTKGGPINLIGDHSSYRYPAETYVSQQAQVMLAKNPSQRQWAYYAIDLVRTTFETGAYMMNHSDECLFKDASGVPVPRPVYGFDGGAGSCGVEKWLEGVQMMVEKGGISGIFLDGFRDATLSSRASGTAALAWAAPASAATTRWQTGLRCPSTARLSPSRPGTRGSEMRCGG